MNARGNERRFLLAFFRLLFIFCRGNIQVNAVQFHLGLRCGRKLRDAAAKRLLLAVGKLRRLRAHDEREYIVHRL